MAKSKARASNMVERQSRNLVLMWAVTKSSWIRQCEEVDEFNSSKKWWQPEKRYPYMLFPTDPPPEMIDEYIHLIPKKEQRILGLL